MIKATELPIWLKAPDFHADACAWVTDFRQQQWQAFLKCGIPSRQHERWKYGDLTFLANKNLSLAKKIDTTHLRHSIHQHRLQKGESILLVMVNGYFIPELSDLHKLPATVIACRLSEAFKTHEELIKPHWPFAVDASHYALANLNAAMGEDGLFFYLPQQVELTEPIHLLSLVLDDAEFIAHPRHVLVLGQHSKLMLMEEHFANVDQLYCMNHVTTIFADKHAQLQHYKIQSEGKKAVHIAQTFIHQAEESTVELNYFSSGAHFARDDVLVKLQGTGAKCGASGFYHLRNDQQFIDHHVDMVHTAARSQSAMLYKGILEQKSRAVFNGRLLIEKNAQKVVGHQANHNLLLSREAEVYSKPELEIYADDVQCKHGATTGQMDEEALFYLRSRGIQQADAVNILLQGFAEEIMQRITHAGIKMRVQEIMSCS